MSTAATTTPNASALQPAPGRAATARRRALTALPQLMPYIYVLVLGGAIAVVHPSLLFGDGAIDGRAAILVPLALVAFGQSLALFTRAIDLSIGGTISLASALLVTHLNGTGAMTWVCVAAVLVGGGLLGALNGWIMTAGRIEPFIVTLGTWSVYGGIALWVLPVDGGTPSPQLIDAVSGSVAGIPKSVIAVAALFVLWGWMRRTRFIQDLYAIGADVARARLTGVAAGRRRIQAFALSGAFAAAAGVWVTAQNSTGSPTVGSQYILNSIAAVVLGGTSIFGGAGSVASAIVGAIAFLMIPDLVFALSLESYWGVFLQGLLLVVAVTANSLIQTRGRR